MTARSKPVAKSAQSTASKPAALPPAGRPVGSKAQETLAAEIGELARLDFTQLRLRWRNQLGGTFPAHLPRWLLTRVLAYRLQVATLGGLDPATLRRIRGSPSEAEPSSAPRFAPRSAASKDGVALRPGALLVREWRGQLHRVMILDEGFAWNGETYSSLSKVARTITGANWNGHRFFGLRKTQADGVGRSPDAQ
ncbi:DUF2924 domain-containing protein [Rhodoblastus sp. 17X3]|uniref:DUF2924 domain-containing protein n=1 Tax=Rhodoblastus sp. 17X3 TaxID=3047026 RepID=UPI0024B808E6|nr:DUF2924 domain-containing protein [Rhodoblastus sp. 17X3]MDI9849675.1 DUF2924 domain-containing protein [Rhodoblastus sp. 17X3]